MLNIPIISKLHSQEDYTCQKLMPDPACLKPAIHSGALIIVIFFLGFGGWATFASLNSAVIASGITVVESSRKKIQHFEGGIVGEILVNDGDHVDKGQILLRLDNTQSKSRLNMARSRLMFAVAIEARLIAELEQNKSIQYPEWISNAPSTKAQVIVKTQNMLLTTRRAAIDGHKNILKQKIRQLQFEITGLRGLRKSNLQQIHIINDELADLETLRTKGLVRKPRLSRLKRDKARLFGTISQIDADVARIEQQIIEIKLQEIEIEANHLKEASGELSEVRAKILDLNEKINSEKDVLTRLDIVAPIEGVIMSLNAHTVGGVIEPGETIMEIIPNQDRLIIEAQIHPTDIDHLYVGLSTQIRFTALNWKFSRLQDGKVIFISPDSLIAEQTGAPHYLVRIALAKNSENLPNNQKIIPGMQTEIMIQTGSKTPLAYLIDPLAQSFNRAWREN